MHYLERAWYDKAIWLWLLWPLSLLFRLLVWIRKARVGSPVDSASDIPVIVIGNITVGGTGKTPLLISLCKQLQNAGMKPGVISRGYGGKSNTFPLLVNSQSDPGLAGDEPVLIASKTGCPVVVDPDRPQALNTLLNSCDVDVVLSDDGLQHYRLPRDIEIAVVDGQRMFGNGMCLPAGPLREPVSRLQHVDFVVLNGEAVKPHPALGNAHVLAIRPVALVNLQTHERRPFGGAPFNIGNRIQAIAALGNPQRFFESLTILPYPVDARTFADHHAFTEEDFAELDIHQPIVMTEKDAIKCRRFAGANMWYVEVHAEFPAPLSEALERRLVDRQHNSPH